MARRIWLAVALALAATACGGESNEGAGSGATETQATTDTEATAGPADTDVAVRETSLGTILTSDEMTLYLFTDDSAGESVCYDECAAAWPPLTTSGEPQAGEGVDASELGATERDDGGMQVTYAGHPLYFFAEDSAAGDANGQGVGGKWYVVSPAGEAIEGEATQDLGY